ncbi:hypothetical protein UFOVP1596_58 [uncultured Caudovirales phage]|uniref:Uncharacterized protein n=1 Tax=uncultured Caudovirales phage TaxID=2100421 RepID=A0A6J5SUG4_9CAUD|nr:hypothetical protein UFOVP1596_58 [uncultured Caudovirales phage]
MASSKKISAGLKSMVQSRANITKVYFDAEGNHYFKAFRDDDDMLNVNGREIVETMTRKEILACDVIEENPTVKAEALAPVVTAPVNALTDLAAKALTGDADAKKQLLTLLAATDEAPAAETTGKGKKKEAPAAETGTDTAE